MIKQTTKQLQHKAMIQCKDDSTSIEDGEGHSNNDDQTEQSNKDEQESTQDDTEGLPQQPNKTTTTSSGRAIQQPAWMDEYEMGMTAAETKYYEAMKELRCCTDDPEQQQHELGLVGAGLGEGIDNTRELKVLSYAEVMERPDRPRWDESVGGHQRMEDNGVFEAVPVSQVPANADVIDSTWAMKKKASGVYRARLAAQGFKQLAGVSYDPRDIMSPVLHEITVRIMLVLMIMALWHTEIIDVKGAFLKASFDPKHKVYMESPEGFEKFYPKNVLLLLKKTLYGVKNAAKAFWLVLLKIMASIGLLRSKADPCLYYTWDAVYGLITILSWIDDLLIFGKREGVLHYNKKITDLIDCDDIGPLTDCIGNKIEFNCDERWVRLTQPVLFQSFKEEFTLSEPNKSPKTPAVPGSVLRTGTHEEGISL